jgi:hypothetical protein
VLWAIGHVSVAPRAIFGPPLTPATNPLWRFATIRGWRPRSCAPIHHRRTRVEPFTRRERENNQIIPQFTSEQADTCPRSDWSGYVESVRIDTVPVPVPHGIRVPPGSTPLEQLAERQV